MRFPPSLIPDWRQPGGPVSFWNQILRDLDRGAMAGSYRRLLLAAHEIYQVNPILRDLHDRYIGLPIPQSVRSLPVDASMELADQPDLLFRVCTSRPVASTRRRLRNAPMFYECLRPRVPGQAGRVPHRFR